MKKCLAILLAVTMTVLLILPGMTVLASSKDAVTVTATSDNPITITPKATLPEEKDTNGTLDLTGGTFDIARDYAQKCMVTVTNNGSTSAEYYLTVSNTYSDIYLNFVRSGSVDIPLVIAAGESQQIQLDVFTQNAQKGQYTLPVYAHVVEDGGETIDAMTTVYLNVPTVNLRVSFSKKSSDPNTLAQVFTLKNNGSSVSDLIVKADDSLKDYVFFSPGYSTYPLKSGETIEFTVSPDLYKMKTNNLTKLEGRLIASAGGSETSVAVSFDTQGQEITTTTMGKLVEYQFGNSYSSLQTKAGKVHHGVLIDDYRGSQCTNAGSTSFNTYTPSTGRQNQITTFDSSDDSIKMFVTSRMFGGEGVNRWYNSSDPDYVDIANTNYDYYLNGVLVAKSKNSGVTDLSITEIPIDNLKFGATNRIVIDYDTNPGHYFVTTDTQITYVYPYDTPISYIGSPDSLPDYRPLPDFCVYSENIFNATPEIVKGVESELTVNIYNRGSSEGTFNIEIKDGNEVIYQEENHELEGFSGDVISFAWTPTQNSHTITVNLTNTTEGMPDRNESNNTASRTFSVRQRQSPRIDSITPDYVVEGESIVYATVSNYADVTKAEFYVDGELYTGEISSSVYSGATRYWINDSGLNQGEHTIRVVIYYINDDDEEVSVESSKDLSVLPPDWDKYTFTVDESLASINCFTYDEVSKYTRRIYSISRNGNQCTVSLSKAEYDAPENYTLFVTAGDTLLFKPLSDNSAMLKSGCRTVAFGANDNLQISSAIVRSVDEKNISATFNTPSVLTLTPGAYEMDVNVSYMGENRGVHIQADVTEEDKVIDLTESFTQFSFTFADEINGTPSAVIYLFDLANQKQTVVPLTKISGNELLAVVSKNNQSSIDNCEKAIICVSTKDVLFVADAKSGSKQFVIDKSGLQKYNLSAGDFTVTEVSVECSDFSATLYAPTVFVTPGEYEITAYCKDLGINELTTNSLSNVKYILQSTKAAENTITFKIPDSYDRYASVYATGSDENFISVDNYFSGNKISVSGDIYSANIGLSRNSAKYKVTSTVDATGSKDVSIGNSFSGKIDNSFATYEAYSKVTLYLSELKDTYGNILSEFSSKNEKDNLKGTLVFTDVEDETETHSVIVSLNNLSAFEAVLPDLDGQYKVSLSLSNDSDFESLIGITLSETELTLNCNRTYKLNAEMNPADYPAPKLVWSSEDENIATVDENGVVKTSAENTGETVIMARTEDGAYFAQCKVTVKYSFMQKIRQICIKIFNAIGKAGAWISGKILDLLNRG